MSRALVCDQCGDTLPLNNRGEADSGEGAAWLKLTTTNDTFDLCTRVCVVAFLERPEVVKAMDEWTETITGIARVINGDVDDEDEEDQ